MRCGEPLDEVVLRSYCIGAAHMALGWVRSEGIAVDAGGEPQDLTIRSFGILRAVDMPRIEVRIDADDGPPVNGSDAVFAAVAAAAWRHIGHPAEWPAAAALTRAASAPRPRSHRGAVKVLGMSAPVGPYTPIVRAGDWLIVSGQLGVKDGGAGRWRGGAG